MHCNLSQANKSHKRQSRQNRQISQEDRFSSFATVLSQSMSTGGTISSCLLSKLKKTNKLRCLLDKPRKAWLQQAEGAGKRCHAVLFEKGSTCPSVRPPVRPSSPVTCCRHRFTKSSRQASERCASVSIMHTK